MSQGIDAVHKAAADSDMVGDKVGHEFFQGFLAVGGVAAGANNRKSFFEK